MKKLIPFLFLFILTGCAITQSYLFNVEDYCKPLPSYPLKLLVYYQPNIEGNQLLEKETVLYRNTTSICYRFAATGEHLLEDPAEKITKKFGQFKILYGSFIVKKFSSAFNEMFKEVKRSYSADRTERLLEAESNNSDLLCEIVKVKHEFELKKLESSAEMFVKAILMGPFLRKAPYECRTDAEIKVTFYQPDGSVLSERIYPYSLVEPLDVYENEVFNGVVRQSNEQFGKGVDEIISQAVEDLKNSEEFKELKNSKEP